jgi:hypothetical protein
MIITHQYLKTDNRMSSTQNQIVDPVIVAPTLIDFQYQPLP